MFVGMLVVITADLDEARRPAAENCVAKVDRAHQ